MTRRSPAPAFAAPSQGTGRVPGTQLRVHDVPARSLLPGAALKEEPDEVAARCRSCPGDQRVDDLGDPVGTDPGLRPVRRRAGGGTPRHHHPAAGRQPAPDAGDRDRVRRGLLLVLLRRRGPGQVAVPPGRQLHRGDGLRDRLHQPGRRARHHPGPADGLAVHPGRVHRRPDHDHLAGAAVPPVPARAAAGRRPHPGRQGAGRLDGGPCGDGHDHLGRGKPVAAAPDRGRPSPPSRTSS